MADEKSLNQTNVGASNPSYVQTTNGIRGQNPPYGGNFGFISPFQDAVLKKIPDSGTPNGSLIPKP